VICCTAPGRIRLWLFSNLASELNLEVDAGQIYYVRGNVSPAGGATRAPELKLIPREIAIKELSSCKPAD
jgi:hypothetical protein